jgi:hypothetical protein
MTGVDAPYQPPTQPDLVLRSSIETVDAAVERVMQTLAARFLHPPRLGDELIKRSSTQISTSS